jgi:hypothetical protein
MSRIFLKEVRRTITTVLSLKEAPKLSQELRDPLLYIPQAFGLSMPRDMLMPPSNAI